MVATRRVRAGAGAAHHRSARRVAWFAGVGGVVAVIGGLTVPWELAALLAWTAGACTYLGLVVADVAGLDAAATKAVANTEDDSESVAHGIVLVAAVASLACVVVGLASANAATGVVRVELTVAAVVAIAVSWGLVHCVYMLRYADLFYDDPVGGVDFPGGEAPCYHDFAYLAVTVGMTFQVADTDITTTSMRRLLLAHSTLAYLFGAVIVAVAINVVAGLV